MRRRLRRPYFGARNPADEAQSSMRRVVSIRLSWRSSISRSGPGFVFFNSAAMEVSLRSASHGANRSVVSCDLLSSPATMGQPVNVRSVTFVLHVPAVELILLDAEFIDRARGEKPPTEAASRYVTSCHSTSGARGVKSGVAPGLSTCNSAALSKRAAEILGSVVALANPNRIAA